MQKQMWVTDNLNNKDMQKTIVNIITEDNPVSAYLFIKEMYKEGDRLMYISAKDTEDDLELMAEVDNVPVELIDEIVLKRDMDEFSYEMICRTIKTHLCDSEHYCVNLAGGTRYLALAVQQVFEDFQTDFYYTDLEDNILIKSKFDDNIYNNDDFHIPIKYKLSIEEYLKIHEININRKSGDMKPTQSPEMSEHFFDLFTHNKFKSKDYKVMELLRVNYRNRKHISIWEVENNNTQKNPQIAGLSDFLSTARFKPEFEDNLTKEEIEFLTGGWFEEYIYYKVVDILHPEQITLNMVINPDNIQRINELDVVYMVNNKLYVIECKSGIESESMFNSIVYKACALRESFLGCQCKSFICALKKDDNDFLSRIAQNMDITFWDSDTVTNKKALENAIKLSIAY